MTEESLKKLFTQVKRAPIETNVADVSQWIDNAAKVAEGTSINKIYTSKKLIIMSTIFTAAIIGTIITFSVNNKNKEDKIVSPTIQKSIVSIISDTAEYKALPYKESQNILSSNQSFLFDTIAQANKISSQKEDIPSITELPNNVVIDAIEKRIEKNIYKTSGSWKSSNDSLEIDTIFNGVKSLVFTGRIIDQISVHGSNRTNVAMNFNYTYKVKGIYTRNNMECELSYEKKDSVLTILFDRKNQVNIGVSYSKETSNISFEVPENIAVQIKTSFGDIDAKGLKNNNFDFQTSHGDIKASVVSGNINLNSDYGDIDLNQLNGKIDIKIGYGDVIGKNINISEQMNIKSSYGDIDCQIINPINDCKLDLKTAYGEVKIKRTDLELDVENKLILGVGNIKITAISGYGDVIIR